MIQTLSIANETTDATVRSRLGVVFAIFPNIQEMSMTRKLTVRVRGQIYDLKTLARFILFRGKCTRDSYAAKESQHVQRYVRG